MAQELADGEFWLPPEFLNDEDILNDFKPKNGTSFLGFGSPDLGSPVESLFGSESDEDDYLTLTRKFSNTSLDSKFETHHFKGSRVMAGSPQSTLCGCKSGSPNCHSPPLIAAREAREPSWDLLYAAAGEVARLRMMEEAASRYYLASNQQKQQPRTTTNPNLNHFQQQLQFQQLKQQQMMKQQQYLQMLQQNRKRNEVNVNGNGSGRNVSAPLNVWPTPQQSQQIRAPGSGMRAVFLRNPNTTKRESTGTGVFLPRQVGAPADPFKKRGCSTVLLPDRVVQALNLNLEAMESVESKVPEADLIYRNMAAHRRNNLRQSPPAMTEFRLPQEWTY